MDILTSFIEDYKLIMKSEFPTDELTIKLKFTKSEISHTDIKTILKSVISYSSRMTTNNHIGIEILLLKEGQTSCVLCHSLCLQEFPACCGKIIIAPIKIFRNLNKGGLGSLMADNTYTGMCKVIFQLIDDIMLRMHYSSYDFVLSDVENTQLFKVIEKVGFKPTSSFRNRRNKYEHTCNTYSRILRELSMTEMAQREDEHNKHIHER